MSEKNLKFSIVTPERIVFEETVRQVTVPTTEGEITILPDHIPLVSVLKAGVVELKRLDGETEIMAVSGGFLEVLPDKVVILADTAEMAHELDESRIEAAKKRAEDRKQENADDVKFTEASVMIEKQLARSKAVKRWRQLKNLK
jgi:F-type H+-transporting ATPase subunit epsilon